MKKLFIKMIALLLISFALNATEVQQQAQPQALTRICNELLQSSKLNLRQHTAELTSAHFSLDGKKIVTASQDGTAKIWDLLSRVGYTLQGDTEDLVSAEFSPDGKLVVTASRNEGAAKIWNALTGEAVCIFKSQRINGRSESLSSAKFSPDGKLVVTASHDHNARIWDVETKSLLKTLEGHTDTVLTAEFSPDGTKVLTASIDGTARIWDIYTGEALHVLENDTQGFRSPVRSAHFSPNSKYVVTASDDKNAILWNVETGQKVRTLEGHTGRVKSAEFSHDGNKVVTSSLDRTARIWNTQTGGELGVLVGHTHGLVSANFSPDGTRIVTASRNGGEAKVWNSLSGECLLTFRGTQEDGTSITLGEFSPDGKLIVTASLDGNATLWAIDPLIVWNYFSNPRLRTDGTTEPLSLEQQALLVLLDDISQEKNGGEITKADLAVRKKWKPDTRLLENYFKNENNETIEKNALLYYVNRPKKPLYPEIDITVFFNSLPEDVRNALKSVYNLNDDIFNTEQIQIEPHNAASGLKRKREETQE